MASAFTHAAAALALGTAFRRPGPPARYWIAGALLAVAPDLDVVAFRFGVPYEHVLGHRGISHSLPIAAVLAALALAVGFRGEAWAGRRRTVWLFLFLATASHALLDMLTNGGHGVALFAPFTEARFFLPWRPIRVSPIGIERFFSARGAAILANEFRWVWLPAIAFAFVCVLARRRQAPEPPPR